MGQGLADPESAEQPERLLETFLERDLPGAGRSTWLKAAAAVAIVAIAVGVWRLPPWPNGSGPSDWRTLSSFATLP